MKKTISKLGALYAVGGAALLSIPAAQAQIDIAAVVTAATADLTTVIVAIGGMLLAAAGLAVGFKWGKAMLFG